ncbi:hypothetical protein F66182_10791 [Fusarium sp. NRRL 66182]|nr:hypothetical protein F66182_10791 [Fusarium sp. NRRL 66182]
MANKKVMLVTGGNSGIGYDTTYALANASPDNHVILSARSSERGQKALAELQARKPRGTISFLELDVTSDDSINAAAKKLEADFGRLDVLVNNAGIATSDDLTRENIYKALNTNVFGALLLTNAIAPLLRKSQDPRIINVSSSAGSLTIRSNPEEPTNQVGYSLYRISKAALNAVTLEQYYFYKGWENVPKIWAYCPGYVVSNLLGEADREDRKAQGVESSETSAVGILEIVDGKRDKEVLGFLGRRGETIPW